MSIKVSVLITAFNEQEKISRCLDSIINQTYKDFEIVLINDGSSDNTDSIIRKYMKDNELEGIIRYINRENKGRIASLNEGIVLSKGKYIAIQDADDYSLPLRLEKQVDFLENHPDIDVVGTSYIRLDSIRNERYIRSYPTTDKEIKKEMCKYIPLCQGSMMIKTDVIRSVGGYNPECKDAEDLDLWTRLGNNVKFANLEEALYVYDLTMQNSFFHSNYKKWDRNLRVFKLNCKAVRVFGLPFYSYIYPVARLIYPYIPNGLKSLARKKVSRISEKNYED